MIKMHKSENNCSVKKKYYHQKGGGLKRKGTFLQYSSAQTLLVPQINVLHIDASGRMLFDVSKCYHRISSKGKDIYNIKEHFLV